MITSYQEAEVSYPASLQNGTQKVLLPAVLYCPDGCGAIILDGTTEAYIIRQKKYRTMEDNKEEELLAFCNKECAERWMGEKQEAP